MAINYHAVSLGGDNGLRGFRDEDFSGKTYFYQTSDLRLWLKRFVTPVMPVMMEPMPASIMARFGLVGFGFQF